MNGSRNREDTAEKERVLQYTVRLYVTQNLAIVKRKFRIELNE